jgi:hypothetical protein
MRFRALRLLCGWFIGLASCLGAEQSLPAETQLAAAPSKFAPVKYLNDQIEYFLKRLDQDLADPAKYGEDQQGRVEKDASTLAVISLVLGKHDENHPRKRSAPAMIKAAAELADAAGDYDSAVAALKQFRTALQSTSDEQLQWEPVANLVLLMQQVPIVNNSLRRGVTGRRFARQSEDLAGLATTLAVIAQASIPDADYCADDEAHEEWKTICADMRDAAAEVLQAIREKDQNAAKAGLERIVKTCDACHDEFRD